MKCPYCGAETKSPTCEYCGSDIPTEVSNVVTSVGMSRSISFAAIPTHVRQTKEEASHEL